VVYDDDNNLTYNGTTKIVLFFSMRMLSKADNNTYLKILLNDTSEQQRCKSDDRPKGTHIECNLTIQLKTGDKITFEFENGTLTTGGYSNSMITRL
jgi:hypothetical protein